MTSKTGSKLISRRILSRTEESTAGVSHNAAERPICRAVFKLFPLATGSGSLRGDLMAARVVPTLCIVLGLIQLGIIGLPTLRPKKLVIDFLIIF